MLVYIFLVLRLAVSGITEELINFECCSSFIVTSSSLAKDFQKSFLGIYSQVCGLYNVHTICPRSLEPFYVVSYYMKWVKDFLDIYSTVDDV